MKRSTPVTRFAQAKASAEAALDLQTEPYVCEPPNKWQPNESTADASNDPYVPEKRDITFWLVLFLVVIPVYAITPISWAYTLLWVYRWTNYVTTQESWIMPMKRFDRLKLSYAVFEVSLHYNRIKLLGSHNPFLFAELVLHLLSNSCS